MDALAQAVGPFAAKWLANPWLLWGLGPLLASNIGFFITATLLELVLMTGIFDSSLICYASSKNAPRKKLMEATHQRIPFWKQFRGSAKYLFGPSNVVNGVVFSLLMQWAKPQASSWFPATAAAFAVQFLALLVLSDFGLYWGKWTHEGQLSIQSVGFYCYGSSGIPLASGRLTWHPNQLDGLD
jgi:hypothetical protein